MGDCSLTRARQDQSQWEVGAYARYLLAAILSRHCPRNGVSRLFAIADESDTSLKPGAMLL